MHFHWQIILQIHLQTHLFAHLCNLYLKRTWHFISVILIALCFSVNWSCNQAHPFVKPLALFLLLLKDSINDHIFKYNFLFNIIITLPFELTNKWKYSLKFLILVIARLQCVVSLIKCTVYLISKFFLKLISPT